MNRLSKQPWRYTILAVLATLTILFGQLSKIDSKWPFHTDEVPWSRTGLTAYKTLFVEHDVDSLWWLKSHNTFGVQNPNIGKYLIGASLWRSGITSPEMITRDEDGAITDANVRFSARLPIAILFSILMITVYALTLSISGSGMAALLSLFLLLAHSTMRYHANLAMLDIPALTFSSLAILLLIYALQDRSRNPMCL